MDRSSCLFLRVSSVVRWILLFLGLLNAGTAFSAVPDESRWVRQFTLSDDAINGGKGYAHRYDNDQGALGWGQSYLLDAYLDLYLATGDSRWIDKVADAAEQLLKKTDVVRGVKDYRGRSLHGWSSTMYGKDGARIVWIVHSGNLYTPLLRFASLAANTPALASYKNVGNQIVTMAEAAAKEFESRWRDDPDGGGTYYSERGEPVKIGEGLALPLNMSLSFGRSLILLYMITGDERYKNRATGLANYLRRYLRLASNGGYEWPYWPAYRSTGVDDLSHGAVVSDFVLEAAGSGIVFGERDVGALVRTLINSYDGKGFSSLINANAAARDVDLSASAGIWLNLATIDCGAYRVISEYFSGRSWKVRQHEGYMLGFAKLARYEGKCEKK